MSFLLFCTLQKQALLEALTYLLVNDRFFSLFPNSPMGQWTLKLEESSSSSSAVGGLTRFSLEMRSLYLASSFAHARSIYLSLMVRLFPFFSHLVQKKMIFLLKCITNGRSVRRSEFPVLYPFSLPMLRSCK